MKPSNRLKKLRNHWKPIFTQGKEFSDDEYILKILIKNYQTHLKDNGRPEHSTFVEDANKAFSPSLGLTLEQYIEYLVYEYFERNTNTNFS